MEEPDFDADSEAWYLWIDTLLYERVHCLRRQVDDEKDRAPRGQDAHPQNPGDV